MSQPNIFIAKLARPLQAGGVEEIVYIDRLTTITGEAITFSDFSLFNRGVLTINPDGDGKRSFPEFISFTGIDVDTIALTGVTRGLSAKDNTVIAKNKRYHPAGTRVAITFGTHDISDVIAYVDNEIAALTLGSNQVVTGTAGETLIAGEVVYLKDDGKWWKARADQAATIYGVQLGIAQGAGTTDAAITNGVLRLGNDTNQSGLTSGQTIYVSDTPGAISTTPGTNERVIGTARGTDNLYFDPSYEVNPALRGGGDFGTPSASNKFLTEDFFESRKMIRRIYNLADSPATWNKPTNLIAAKIEVWGSGAGGGTRAATTGDVGGGGGGGYVVRTFIESELSSSHTITVAAGGSAGGSGATSSFGSLLTATGGSAPTSIRGGAGGGYEGGSGGANGTPGDVPAAGGSYGGGGGGFGYNDTEGTTGGAAFWGGGGGGGLGRLGSGGGGGSSVNGGAGGASSTSSNGGVGQVPGGGGGAYRGVGGFSGGAGGAGRVIVTEYYS